jgi:hypothetical protein
MTGRIRLRDTRVYVDGYDLSGYSRSFGPLACVFEEGVDDALTLDVKATMPGSANVTIGTLNGIFDNTATSGLHVVMEPKIGTLCDVLFGIGVGAPPVNNDPCFGGSFDLMGYYAGPQDIPITATMPFGNMSSLAANLEYAKPWGTLLHASAAATAANTAVGLDQTAQSLKGGWMMYHIIAAAGTGDKTATIKVQDADTNVDGSFGDLLSSGVLNCAAGMSGIVALATNATVERYVRWQLALGTATSVTFALGWFRNNL